MYIDGVVVAGVGTVLLMIGFMVAVGWFVVRDARNKAGGKHNNQGR